MTRWPVALSNLVPRPLAVSAAASVAVVLAVALASPGSGVPSFLVRIAELLLAGGAAYALDDAASVLTDVTPRSVWRRRAPVLAASGALLAAAWLMILLVLRWQDSSPAVLAATGEVAVLCLLAVSAAGVLAGHGEPEPGALVAPAVALLGIGALIVQALLSTRLFLSEEGGSGSRPWLAWTAAGVVALLVLLVASRDPAARRRRVRRTL